MSSSLEHHDRLRVSSVSSFDDVQGLFSSTRASSLSAASLQELTTPAYSLEKLKDFMDFVSNEASGALLVLWCTSFNQKKVLHREDLACFALSANIEFLNKYRGKAANGSVWEPLEQQLQTFSKPSSPTQGPEELATLPCFIYPASKTPRFFDRTEDIIQMDRYFNNRAQYANQLFRSLALYGIGGVGKSSVALCPKTMIQIGFSSWISYKILSTASRGQAVITTRNHNFAFYPADGGLEITEWDAEIGSQFLLHLLSTDINNQLTKDEVYSAYGLSSKLSGHALALSLMAGLIRRRS
ncbi:hypothetical protein F4801DRAFT_602741 [Xylaria longipes]|nr:hypothetical protein F4801DRAFT_602741 [Xylaria longipes]